MIQPLSVRAVTPFDVKVAGGLKKRPISVLQVNLGRRCNLSCSHCHVEAGPKRTEELSPLVCQQLIEIIQRFEQIKTVDLTGGAPEMNFGFKPIVEAARKAGKEVIVRSNLTIYFEPGFEDLPIYFAANKLRVVASLPCYLADNVDKMRGSGVFDASIRALQWLNRLGYASDPSLILDLVYNPPLPLNEDKFSLPPEQGKLEKAYKAYLNEHFGIHFNQLFTITNLPIGRSKFHLKHRGLMEPYLGFLENNFNGATVENLMCRNHLSVDFLGNIYDCDFNQMEKLPARNKAGENITLGMLLDAGRLDLIEDVQTANFCYGCTAGSGSSCGGALV
ncbi:arsenosugar biosynthesis radical SAM protein ArsS [Ancylothrix sp. C2]|uniref:arsenosugar biosynthesis radical SAM (seleno)protein ArsS n=1 Tax=Ancylothrix sp. D3o TaxID=2953691 RepID=UPI0021BB0374|nr:arsenosugar biosynthesis radical SAM (seleno)protein ArsS [Ancylothrix sp. D3o]MCT7948310.1 arsenosugar biosynthesis radical SAM protein ArsS [Ancylothrix sp. D3o]